MSELQSNHVALPRDIKLSIISCFDELLPLQAGGCTCRSLQGRDHDGHPSQNVEVRTVTFPFVRERLLPAGGKRWNAADRKCLDIEIAPSRGRAWTSLDEHN